jgi:hypothetical protein
MARSGGSYSSIRSEGALLPPDLLARVQAGDGTLPGLTPEAYHLPGTMRLNEAASRAWNALLGAWHTFEDARERLPQGDAGTTVTRERWLLPLFQELGYGRLQVEPARELDGRSYALSHAYRHLPIHLVGCNIDLDKRTRGVAGAATGSPHSLLQEFLNRSEHSLWGIVSNGLRLRVLRDNLALTRQAYLEFDLRAMMEGEAYSDFVVLFLVLHQSRFENEPPQDCYVEQWSEEAARTGTRVLENLSYGVERAIEALGQGFLQHPRNEELRQALRGGDLSGQDYYRQLLRLVYRLLFLFVAEDRDALHPPDVSEQARQRYFHYSTQRLRQLADEIRGGRHGDAYESLQVVFKCLGGRGELALALPGLGSFLFSAAATKRLTSASLANAYLYRAVRALAYAEVDRIRRPVDYRNLGTEELGGVYETLLELHPLIDTVASTFSLGAVSGHERRATGSYYTQRDLISLLLDTALDPVIDSRTRGKTGEEAEAALLGIKVVDPACGSGHFLIAAAQRLAKRVAAVRTGDDEPPPEETRKAIRDVADSCLYGVDVNEMSAELCKVALWMEALEPGKPLNFLDHRIQVGNSLIGATPNLIVDGIPDEAYSPIHGDDTRISNLIKRRNREERAGQGSLFGDSADVLDPSITVAFKKLEQMPTETESQVRAKERAHQAILEDQAVRRGKLLADLWTAAFLWPLGEDESRAPTTDDLSSVQNGRALPEARQIQLVQLETEYRFFHWHLAFPEVFGEAEDRGFDVVLGNPPWGRVKLKEREWFASRAPEIASERNASRRERQIAALEESDPILYMRYIEDKRRSEGYSHFIRASGRYPLTGRGDVNTYTAFAELDYNLLGRRGRMGVVIPTGIAFADGTRHFFERLIETNSLSSLIDFWETRRFFPGTDSRDPFCLLTVVDHSVRIEQATFVFSSRSVLEARDPERRFTLSAEDIALLNPNTKTCPVFGTQRDAELTKRIYRRVPVLLTEATGKNPWGIDFQRMFDMSNDSGLFRTQEQLEAEGLTLTGNHFVGDGSKYVPLYEAKMFHQFDHRFATYTQDGTRRDVTPSEHEDPHFVPIPRFWVDEQLVQQRLNGDAITRGGKGEAAWLLAFRNVTNNTNERTVLFSILPAVGVGNSAPLMRVEPALASRVPALLAALNSFVLDYVARQKVGGTNLNFFYVKQFPVPSPHDLDDLLLREILTRSVELTYSAYDLDEAAQAAEWQPTPFLWHENRRFQLQAELDAIFFHVYGLERDDVEYVMETFPIVKRKDEAEHGHYRTKEAILAAYEQFRLLVKQ